MFTSLKELIAKQFAKARLPSSFERELLAEDIAGRIIRKGEIVNFDKNGLERFARNCIDESLDAVKRKIDEERGAL